MANSFPSFRVRDGVTVVYQSALLDFLFPDGIGQLDPEVWLAAQNKWVEANGALYYEWGGESWMRIAHEDHAVERAIAERKGIVVVAPQS